MNWLDIVISVILVVVLFLGLKAGLIKMVVSSAGLVLGIFLAGRFYQILADILTFISSDRVAAVVGYIIILFAVIIISSLVAWFLGKIVSIILLGWLNRLSGAVLGLFIASIFIGAILAVLAKYGGGVEIITDSVLGKWLLNGFPLVLALLPQEFDTIKSFFE
jgi:membrane protein required for colicin V production